MSLIRNEGGEMKKIKVEICVAADEEKNLELSVYKIKEMLISSNFYARCLVSVELLPPQEDDNLTPARVAHIETINDPIHSKLNMRCFCPYCERNILLTFQPPTPKPELPEEFIDKPFVYYSQSMWMNKINQLIRYLRSKE